MMFSSPKNERRFALLFFSCIWIYLWLRAAYVPFLFDEITTFFFYIQPGKFIPWFAKWDANNHILNSALSHLSYTIFGLSELSLRLPNLLFAPLMFYASYKISKEFQNRLLAWIFILTLTCNHFFIEYSALTRGYGMSMSLLLASIWFTIQIIRYDSVKYYILSLLSILLYLSANLTLVYTAIFTVLIILINAIIRNNEHLKSLFSKVFLIVVFGIAPIIGSVYYLFELKNMELLYYGIPGGFWHVTLETLTFNSIGSNILAGPFVVAFLFAITTIAGIYKLSKSKTVLELTDPGFIFFFLLVFNIAMVVSLHYLMDIKYPEDRVALFFIPLFLGSFFFMVDYAVVQAGFKKLILLTVPLLCLPVFFVYNLNLSYTIYWKTQSVPERFISTVKTKKTQSGFPPSVGSDYVSANIWAMYNYMDNGSCNLINYADSVSVTDDFLIANYDANPEWRNLYDSLDYDKLSDKHLLRKKTPAPKTLFGVNDKITSDSISTEPYYLFYNGYIDKISGKEILVTISMTMESSAIPFTGYIVFDIFDNKNNSIYYSANPLHRIRKSWDGTTQNFNYSFKTKPTPENCFKLKVYLWNPNNQPYFVQDGRFSVYYY